MIMLYVAFLLLRIFDKTQYQCKNIARLKKKHLFISNIIFIYKNYVFTLLNYDEPKIVIFLFYYILHSVASRNIINLIKIIVLFVEYFLVS